MMPATERASSEFSDLSAHILKLQEQNNHQEVLELFKEVVEKLTEKNSQLEWRVMALLRQLYRKKSEKVSPDQLALALAQLSEIEVQPEVNVSDPVVCPEAEPKDTKKQGNTGRKKLPPNLPRQIEVIEPSKEARTCARCGQDKAAIGYDSSELLELVPAQFKVIERRRMKYACKPCQGEVVIAPAAPNPIEGGTVGPGLLTDVVIRKYKDHCPLYRMSEIYERYGLRIAPSTLGDWVTAAADLFAPLAKALQKDTLSRYLLSLDDTGLCVLDRDEPSGAKRGHLWCYVGDGDKVLFYHYTPTWKAAEPCALLQQKRGGVIQGDGYAGYQRAEFPGPEPPPKRAGCWAHARRKFVAALDAGDTRASIAVTLIRKLYAVESDAREQQLDAGALLLRRQAISKPVAEQLGQWVVKLQGAVPPKSPLSKALTYAVRQWSTLIVFLDDGQIPIDNNHVERQIRPIALGRKNWLFAGSDEGAKRAAILMTLIGNCALNKIPLRPYLQDVIERLSNNWPHSRLAELLPAAWAAAQPRQNPDTQAF